MSLLELDDVQSYYGNIHALMGISLRVEQGEIVALIGANGAGKTTTLRSISGLLHPRKGKVLLEGNDVEPSCPRTSCTSWAWAWCPKAAASSPASPSARTWRWAPTSSTTRTEIQENVDERLRPVPPAEGAGPAEGRDPVRRRAADARHRPGPHVRPQDPAHGRTLHGPRAGAGGPDLRHHQELQRPAGTTILLVEQNALMALSIAHRGYVLQTGQIVLTDTGQNLKANDMVRKAYLGI